MLYRKRNTQFLFGVSGIANGYEVAPSELPKCASNIRPSHVLNVFVLSPAAHADEPGAGARAFPQ